MEHGIDDNAKDLAANLSDDDKAVFLIQRLVHLDIQHLAQMDERQKLVAQAQDRRVIDALDAMLRIMLHPHQFHHGELRDGIAVTRTFNDQGRNNGQRQRNLDGEGGALARH